MDACLLSDRVCGPDFACAFHEDWSKVRKDLVSLLETRTISEAAIEVSKSGLLRKSPHQSASVEDFRDDDEDDEHAIPSPA